VKELKIYRVDTASCNGCDIEIVAMLAPKFKLGNLEFSIVEEPEEANALMVTGGLTAKSLKEVSSIYEKIKEEKLVIAVGACAISKGVFQKGYPLKGGIDKVLPVDIYISGCPPRPHTMLLAFGNYFNIDLKKELKVLERTFPSARGLPIRDEKKCTACGACVNLCPSEALEMIEKEKKKIIKLKYWKCIYCGTCEEVCPEEAVKLSQEVTIFFKEKERAENEIELTVLACSLCGKSHATIPQRDAVLKRILKNEAGFKNFENEIVNWLNICPDCSHRVQTIKRVKLRMFEIGKEILKNKRREDFH